MRYVKLSLVAMLLLAVFLIASGFTFNWYMTPYCYAVSGGEYYSYWNCMYHASGGYGPYMP